MEALSGSVMPMASMPRGSCANPGRTRACCSALKRLLHDLRDLEGLREDDRHADVAVCQFLDHHRGGQRVGAKTAPFLGERHGADARPRAPSRRSPRKSIAPDPCRHRAPPRAASPLLDEARHGLQDGALVLIEGKHLFHVQSARTHSAGMALGRRPANVAPSDAAWGQRALPRSSFALFFTALTMLM